ncbi:MAG: hypothetical protein K0S32_336 [Bacteroidetes bacterium]|jgi:hypothetical protein|nr:hypothetical protein [Bacteroidota bacterium]
MKTSRSTTTRQNKQGNSKKPRPEIRDDMDSRQSKESGYIKKTGKKGDRKKSQRDDGKKTTARKLKAA